MPLQVSDPTREYQSVDEAVLSALESVQYVLDDITRLQPPAHINPSWRTYVIRLPHRHEIIRSSQQRGIEAETHFTPMHTRPLYKHLCYQEGCVPVAEKVTRDLICLPFHPHLSDEEVNCVIDALAGITQQKDMVS